MPRDAKDLVRASFRVIETADQALLEAIVHPDYTNREADGAASGARGIEAFAASVAALRASFSELRFDVQELIHENDLVAAHAVMHGCHTGQMRSLPPSGKTFAQNQSHWYRVRDGLLFEHWANRDDLGFLHQVGAMPGPRVGSPPRSTQAANSPTRESTRFPAPVRSRADGRLVTADCHAQPASVDEAMRMRLTDPTSPG